MTRFIVFIFVFIFQWSLKAQNSDDALPLPSNYLIKNVTVVQKPGLVLKSQDVLIQNGTIASIGKGLTLPINCQLIKGDSAYLYAGFIDGFSHLGMPEPDKKNAPKIENPLNPPDAAVGITPQITATDLFNSEDKAIAEWRNQGFTISNIAPIGPFLSGQTSVMLLGEGSAQSLQLKKSSGNILSLSSAGRAYPATSIGVMAKFRDLIKNTKNYKTIQEKYTKNQTSIPRPEFNEVYEALVPITEQTKPVFFAAPTVKDIHKATLLSKELQFQLCLVDVQQAWSAVAQRKMANANVFLSLALPQITMQNDSMKTIKNDSLMTSKKNLEEVQFDSLRQNTVLLYQSQAAILAKKGVPFGFSLLTAKSKDFKKSLLTYIDKGLSEDAALAALTTYPALVLGIDKQAGTIEKGKIANLILTDSPFFTEKSNIVAVFVEGKMYRQEIKSQKKSSGKHGGQQKFDGTWSYTVSFPEEPQKGNIFISTSGPNFTIQIEDNASDGKRDDAKDITADGNKLTFSVIAQLGKPTNVDFDLTFDGDSYDGTIFVEGFGFFPIEGTRISSPEIKSMFK